MDAVFLIQADRVVGDGRFRSVLASAQVREGETYPALAVVENATVPVWATVEQIEADGTLSGSFRPRPYRTLD